MEKYSDYMNIEPITPYKEGVVFSKIPIKKRPKKYRPGMVRLTGTKKPFSTVWLCFKNGEDCDIPLYEIDKELFLQKMEEWEVRIDSEV